MILLMQVEKSGYIFNDYGNSVIEKKYKKDRKSSTIYRGTEVTNQYEVKYSDENFESIVDKAIQRLNKWIFQKSALLFSMGL